MIDKLYIIEYCIHDLPKSFIIRVKAMSNAEAWHWACCDAGVGIIPKFGREQIRLISRPFAERYGITDVRWRPSGSIPFQPADYIPPAHDSL